jgi:plastocyanin
MKFGTFLSTLRSVAGGFGLACVLMACGTSSSANPPAPPAATPTWLTSDAGTKSVKLTLILSYNSDNAGFNFNGYSGGKMTVSVPDGWTVTADCQNHGNGNHSCAIVKKAGDSTPAFPGSATVAPTQGFPGGQAQPFTFTTATPGTYRITCQVAGHDEAGMWDTFIVTAGGVPQVTFG